MRPLKEGEQPTRVEVGHKDGRVIFNLYGTADVEPSYIAWTPEQAREVAQHLLRCAALVLGECEDCRSAVAGLCRAHALRALGLEPDEPRFTVDKEVWRRGSRR